MEVDIILFGLKLLPTVGWKNPCTHFHFVLIKEERSRNDRYSCMSENIQPDITMAFVPIKQSARGIKYCSYA